MSEAIAVKDADERRERKPWSEPKLTAFDIVDSTGNTGGVQGDDGFGS
ncbi:hypothetical protein [Azospirillum soli]|nr:hypothetical protein [Azospirillum soli]MBP2312716.1 hypothetical protein [Azospirillum soli]